MAFSAPPRIGLAAGSSCSRSLSRQRCGDDSPRHVPVLLDRVVALLAPALDARRAPSWSTPPSASAATPRRSCSGCPAARRGRHRPRPGGAAAGRRAARAVRRPGHRSCTRCTTRSPRCSPTSALAARRRGPVRPRRLLDAARRAPSAASPTPRTRRSTCGWTRPPARPPPTSSTPTPRPSWPGSCASTARRSSPGGSPTRIVRERETEPFTTSARARRAAVRTRSRRPPGVPAATRPSAPSRRCASRSTTSSRAAAGAPAAHRRARRVGGRVVVSPTTRSRTGWSSRRSPPRPQRRPAGPAVRPRRARAGAAAAHPRRREGRRRRGRREPARRLGPAARRRTHPRRAGAMSGLMSSRPSARPAAAASRRPRSGRQARRAGPADGRPAARRRRPPPGAVRDLGASSLLRRRGRAAAAQHLDAAGVLRGHRRWSTRPTSPRAPAGAGAARWSSTTLARPAARRRPGPADGHGAADQPGLPRLSDGKVPRRAGPGHGESTGAGGSAPSRRPKPPVRSHRSTAGRKPPVVSHRGHRGAGEPGTRQPDGTATATSRPPRRTSPTGPTTARGDTAHGHGDADPGRRRTPPSSRHAVARADRDLPWRLSPHRCHPAARGEHPARVPCDAAAPTGRGPPTRAARGGVRLAPSAPAPDPRRAVRRTRRCARC